MRNALWLLLLLLLLCAVPVLAQPGQRQIAYVTVAPSGACSATGIDLLTPNGTLYTCQSGTWGAVGGGGASPAGSAGCVQLYATSTTFGCGTNFFYNPTNSTGMTGVLIASSAILEPDLSCCDDGANALSVLRDGKTQINFINAGQRAANSFDYYTSRGTIAVPTDSQAGDYSKEEQYLAYASGDYAYIAFHDVYLNTNGGGQLDFGLYDNMGSSNGYIVLKEGSIFCIGTGSCGFDKGFLQYGPAVFTDLVSMANGTTSFCSDCTVTSGIDNTCAASGSGAWAERVNGAWKCWQ